MKKKIIWEKDGSFSFSKGYRPSWSAQASKIKVNKGEDRRHGLHGADIITKACKNFINNELRRSGREQTQQKLIYHLSKRYKRAWGKDSLDTLILYFHKYAFSRTSNLMPGGSDYNRAIENIKKVIITTREKLHKHFFSKGALPDEIDFQAYKKYAIELLRPKPSPSPTVRKEIINNSIEELVIPAVEKSPNINTLEDCLQRIIDSSRIDIAFESNKDLKEFNSSSLSIDARLKRGVINQEGLNNDIVYYLLGPPNKKMMEASRSSLFGKYLYGYLFHWIKKIKQKLWKIIS